MCTPITASDIKELKLKLRSPEFQKLSPEDKFHYIVERSLIPLCLPPYVSENGVAPNFLSAVEELVHGTAPTAAETRKEMMSAIKGTSDGVAAYLKVLNLFIQYLHKIPNAISGEQEAVLNKVRIALFEQA